MHVNVCIDMFCSAGSMSPVGNRSSCLPQYHDANGYSETQATYGFPTKVFLPFAAHRPSQPSYSLRVPRHVWCTNVSSPENSSPDDSSLYRKKLCFTVY